MGSASSRTAVSTCDERQDEAEDVREAFGVAHRSHIRWLTDRRIGDCSTRRAEMTYLTKGTGRVERPPLRRCRLKIASYATAVRSVRVAELAFEVALLAQDD